MMKGENRGPELAGEEENDHNADQQQDIPAQGAQDMDKLKYDICLDETAFAQIERDFREVISELVGDESLDVFRMEYEKLHTALKQSHSNEKVLVQRIRELAQQLAVNNQKVRTALRLSKEDQATIASLKAEIDKAWKVVDLAREKEGTQAEEIEKLKSEVAALSALVDKGPGAVTVPEEMQLEDLVRAKDLLQQEYDSRGKRITQLREEMGAYLERIRTLESEKVSLELKLRALREQTAQYRADAARELQYREHVDKELATSRLRCDVLDKELLAKEQDVAALKQDLSRAEEKRTIEAAEVERLKKAQAALSEKYQASLKELQDQIRINQTLQEKSAEKEEEYSKKQGDLKAARAETLSLQKQLQQLAQKVELLQTQKICAEERVQALKTSVQDLEAEVSTSKQAINEGQQELDSLTKTYNVLEKNLRTAQLTSVERQELLQAAENQHKVFEQEINGYKQEAQKQRKIIFSLEKEREKYGKQASDFHQRYLAAVQEVKMRDLAIADLQKRILEIEGTLRQQQNLYESARADRNLYSKTLTATQDEISELRRKFRILTHVIQQLKLEVTSKDEALVKSHFDHRQAVKERELVSVDLDKTKQQIVEAEAVVARQKVEIARLNHIIAEADSERSKQIRDYKKLIFERDVLGTNLIRRNDELALLYEKIRIQQATLAKGESQYTDRIEDIKMLRIKIADLKRQLIALRKQGAAVIMYRSEVLKLQKELIEEKAKNKALVQELRSPMNVHRWRELEGADPTTYELLKKVQHLQKRLISKTEEAAAKDLQIMEKEKLYTELKKIVAKQPGPEVFEKLSTYKEALKNKNVQLKTVSAELGMFQAQSTEYKEAIEKLTTELQELKRKYFAYKKREYEELKMRAEEEQKQQEALGQSLFDAENQTESRKFVGGGFSVINDGRTRAFN